MLVYELGFYTMIWLILFEISLVMILWGEGIIKIQVGDRFI
jgi:hypothetical protein